MALEAILTDEKPLVRCQAVVRPNLWLLSITHSACGRRIVETAPGEWVHVLDVSYDTGCFHLALPQPDGRGVGESAGQVGGDTQASYASTPPTPDQPRQVAP